MTSAATVLRPADLGEVRPALRDSDRPARDRGRGHRRDVGRAARAGRRRAGHHRAHRRHHPQPRRHDGGGARGHPAARAAGRAGRAPAARVAGRGPGRRGRHGRRPARHRRRRARRARARLAARPRHRGHARAGRRHGRPLRRPRDQERGGLRPGQGRARLLRHARRGGRGGAAAAPRAQGRGHRGAALLAGRGGGGRRPACSAAPPSPRRWSGPATTCCCCGWKAPTPRWTPAPTRVRELLGAGAAVADGDPWARHAALTRGDPDAAVLRIGVRPSPAARAARLAARDGGHCRAGHRRRDGHGARGRRRRRARAPCTPRAAPRCCAPARPGRTCPLGGRRRRRWRCCARSNTPSTPTTASVPAASTPGCDPVPGAFDTHRPPSRELLDDCVHCGFCLPTCPTYQLWGEEMDSPRGRIYLMSLAEKGEIGLEARSPRTSTAASAAWRASRRARRACSTTGCWRPPARSWSARSSATRTTSCSATRSSRCSRTSGGCARPPLPGGALPGAAPDPGDPRARRAAAGQAGRDGVAAAAGLGARRVRPPARAHPRRRAPPRPGRAAHRLRAGRVLPPRQRGHRAGARRRGLGRARAPRPAVLRRAGVPLRPRGARAGPGPARDRRLRPTWTSTTSSPTWRAAARR